MWATALARCILAGSWTLVVTSCLTFFFCISPRRLLTGSYSHPWGELVVISHWLKILGPGVPPLPRGSLQLGSPSYQSNVQQQNCFRFAHMPGLKSFWFFMLIFIHNTQEICNAEGGSLFRRTLEEMLLYKILANIWVLYFYPLFKIFLFRREQKNLKALRFFIF